MLVFLKLNKFVIISSLYILSNDKIAFSNQGCSNNYFAVGLYYGSFYNIHKIKLLTSLETCFQFLSGNLTSYVKIFCMITLSVAPLNGGEPQNNTYIITPILQISHF